MVSLIFECTGASML